MKVVINRCFGGFWLSDAACERLIELGMKCTTYNTTGGYVDEDAPIVKSKPDGIMKQEYYFSRGHGGEMRANPLLVQVVEELGDKASGRFAELKVVEIPDGVEWEIDEYDGIETIHEKHRSWS